MPFSAQQLLKKKTWLIPTLVLACGLLARFWPMLLGETLFFGDNYSLMVPGKIFTAFWLRRAILPWSNPYLFGGISWFGDINQSVLYISSLIFAVFEPAWALSITTLGHLALSFFGMWWLSGLWLGRSNQNLIARLLAAILWTFSSQLTGSINNLSTLQSMSWMPWVVGFGWKLQDGWKWQVGFVVMVWLQLAGGYPQHVLYSVGLAGLLSLFKLWEEGQLQAFKSWFLMWLKVGLLVLGATAILWMPFWQVLQNSTRTLQSTEQSVAGSLAPAELLKLVVPYIFDWPTTGIKWGPTWNKTPNVMVYVTWFGLSIISWRLLARKFTQRDWFFAVITLVSFGLALGEFLPGFSLLQKAIPLFKIVRGPSIVLMIPSLIFPLWIGQSWLDRSELVESAFFKRTKRFIWLKSWLLFVGAALMWWFVRFDFASIWQSVDALTQNALTASSFHTLERDYLIASMVSTSLLVAVGSWMLSLWAWRTGRYWFLVAVVAADMLFHTQGMLFFAPNSIYPSWQEIESAELPMLEENPRDHFYLIRNLNQPYTDFNTYWEALTVRQPFSDSFIDESELQDFTHLKRLSRGLTPNWNMVYGIKAVNGYTTLLPKSVNKQWNQTDEVAINNLPPIEPTNPQLAEYGVDRYLVDTGFAVNEDVSQLKLIKSYQTWNLYELPTEGSLGRSSVADLENGWQGWLFGLPLSGLTIILIAVVSYRQKFSTHSN